MAYILLDLRYYIQVNLAINIMKMVVLVKTQPYQMTIHNLGICYNSAILILGFIWLILEDFYLLSPPTTKMCAYALMGGLVGVLAMSGVRVIANACFIFKEEAKDAQIAPLSSASKDNLRSK